MVAVMGVLKRLKVNELQSPRIYLSSTLYPRSHLTFTTTHLECQGTEGQRARVTWLQSHRWHSCLSLEPTRGLILYKILSRISREWIKLPSWRDMKRPEPCFLVMPLADVPLSKSLPP